VIISLYQTFVSPLLPESNIPHLPITPYWCHCFWQYARLWTTVFKHRKSKISSKISDEHLESWIAAAAIELAWCTSFTKTRSCVPLDLCCCCLLVKIRFVTYMHELYFMGAALKVVLPVLWSWPVTSEADVGGMAAEVEPSHQHPIPCCCCVTDGSRGALWHNGIWHGSVDEAEGCHWILPCGKSGTHGHSSTLAECLWRPSSGCSTVRHWWCISVVTVGHLHWCGLLWAQHAGCCLSLVKTHS